MTRRGAKFALDGSGRPGFEAEVKQAVSQAAWSTVGPRRLQTDLAA
jgi:hypothetical protein